MNYVFSTQINQPIDDAIETLKNLISMNIQPGSRGELLGGAHCRQDHEPEIDHGDEHDTVSARYEPV
jgi:hypothetical protein